MQNRKHIIIIISHIFSIGDNMLWLVIQLNPWVGLIEKRIELTFFYLLF